MTKLSQVVRGVEEKAVGVSTKEHKDSHMFGESNCPDCIYNNGYNSLASAEVVVDRYELARTRFKGITKKTWDSLPIFHEDKKEIEAIATAIESGAVLYLKEKE